ncbi:hypothetical protein ZOSMA_133G00170 [Zostera marina]|uniref:Uncharacterized protein n=1 Tax=Zostera marina TaxID=29655 RepID=A0A0K9PZ32_ZOSMR|nr:hypothetical protein ZOSMA_133G00170 [Zostera marina]
MFSSYILCSFPPLPSLCCLSSTPCCSFSGFRMLFFPTAQNLIGEVVYDQEQQSQ